MLIFVANQLGIDPKLFGDCAHRAATRREHSLNGLGVLQARLWQSHTCAGLRLVYDCYNSPHLRVTVLPAAVVAWE